jgi:hypothetical protein
MEASYLAEVLKLIEQRAGAEKSLDEHGVQHSFMCEIELSGGNELLSPRAAPRVSFRKLAPKGGSGLMRASVFSHMIIETFSLAPSQGDAMLSVSRTPVYLCGEPLNARLFSAISCAVCDSQTRLCA